MLDRYTPPHPALAGKPLAQGKISPQRDLHRGKFMLHGPLRGTPGTSYTKDAASARNPGDEFGKLNQRSGIFRKEQLRSISNRMYLVCQGNWIAEGRV